MIKVDFDKIKNEFQDDWEIFEEIFALYKESSEEAFNEMRQELQAQDAKALEIKSHTLKGAASNLYCQEIRDLLQKIEELARSQSFDGCAELIDETEKLNQELLLEFEQFLKNP